MRVSATQLESFRLWSHPDNEWFNEQELIDSIRGVFVPNRKINLGSAFGRVLEDPDRYVVPGGFRIVSGDTFEFGHDVMEPCLALIDRRGVFEAKAVKTYGDCEVASRADHILGTELSEFKTTTSSFNFDKYADSYQWRLMADAFVPRSITYHVFVLDDATNGVISLKSIESFTLFPYVGLHQDCCDLLDRFKSYVMARGLDGVLRARQEAA